MSDARLDPLDLRLLAQLQVDGRLTAADLAAALGLPEPSCRARVERLQFAGYIAGYGAHLELQRFGDPLLTFTEVTLADHRPADLARFEAAVRGLDQVLECHLVSGAYDYMLKCVATGVASHQQLMDRLLGLDIGVESLSSTVVVQSVVVNRAYPLETLVPV